jgi:hypothetical protein
VEDGITGQDHDRPAADRWGQFSHCYQDLVGA